MFNRILVACLVFIAISAQAQLISFSTTQFDVNAIALSDGAPDFQSVSSPPDPVSASAVSVGDDVATAGAFAGAGLLSTSADVSGVTGGVVSAVSTSHFLGSFASESHMDFDIDFTINDFTSGSGGGDTTLFVTLMNGATTVFDDYISGSHLFDYDATPGAIGTLELTLTSEANAGLLTSAPGSFSSAGLVNITSPVPEPETYSLFVIGLIALGSAVRRKRKTSTGTTEA